MTRRQQILDTAAELFAAHGFHGVSVADLGRACGISGPALYKHFPSKESLLAEMLTGSSEGLLASAREHSAGKAAPEALAALIAWHADFALHHRALIIVQDRDWAALPAADRERVRALQRAYVALWTEHLRTLHPELDDAAAHALIQAAFGLLNSTPRAGRVPDRTLGELLVGAARRTLDLPADAAEIPPGSDVPAGSRR